MIIIKFLNDKKAFNWKFCSLQNVYKIVFLKFMLCKLAILLINVMILLLYLHM